MKILDRKMQQMNYKESGKVKVHLVIKQHECK